jgi:hypothetical protein
MALPPPSACRVEPVMKLAQGEKEHRVCDLFELGGAAQLQCAAEFLVGSPHSASTPSVLVDRARR